DRGGGQVGCDGARRRLDGVGVTSRWDHLLRARGPTHSGAKKGTRTHPKPLYRVVDSFCVSGRPGAVKNRRECGNGAKERTMGPTELVPGARKSEFSRLESARGFGAKSLFVFAGIRRRVSRTGRRRKIPRKFFFAGQTGSALLRPRDGGK